MKLFVRCCFAFTGVVACGHDAPKTPKDPGTGDGIPQASTPSSPPQYIVADPVAKSGAATVVLPIGAQGVHGLVVDRRRVVIGPGEPRVAADAAPDPIVGAAKIPTRLGNGFLFWTANSLYRSDAFDSPLRPLARVPDSIESISFMPKALLVRTKNGERWGFNLPNADRAAITPLGAADIEAIDDGRAIAFNDQGAVFTSIDHGAHWTDATTSIKSSPSKTSNIAGEVWLIETNGGALRLELDGHLSYFDHEPSDKTPELRQKDPRWHGADTPLHAVFHAGAAIDESTAIVLDSGDLMHIDVRTGEILSVVQGRLPPDAQCEAVPVPGDVLFACVSKTSGSSSNNSGGSAFVVSHTLSSDAPSVEQTLAGGSQFWASDDGGLVYGGSCQASTMVQTPGNVGPTACVRLPSGHWEERDLTGLMTTDGGVSAPASDINVARWIPRGDGRVVALIAEPSLGIYDPVTATFTSVADDAKDIIGRGAPSSPSVRSGKIRTKKGFAHIGGIVDASWSFGAGASIRGWQRHGESVEISEDGRLTRSPFAFDVAFAGAMGLGRSKDGRLYQSADHGASWSEVATPPTGVESGDLVSCTSAGCDLGAFYRIGWQFRAPRVDVTPKSSAPDAPEVRRTKGLELSCKPAGSVVSKILPRTENSPEDLGFGISRLSVPNEKNDWSFVRNTLPLGIVSPIHDPGNGSDDGTPALRGMLTGFGTTRDSDVITVTGPNKSAMALRRGLSYIAPFDPSGRIIRTGINMSEVVAAGRKSGMTTDEILSEDFTESGVAVTLTSSDPFAPSDIAIHNTDHGLLSIVHGERVKVAIRTSQNNASVVSGVVLPQDESAFLELDSSGVGHVFKVGASGTITDQFDVSPTGTDAYYPANPDALAVDAKGNLAILRTPSGSDPASALDPAYLIIPATPPTQLAPWSELKLADDPACKGEAGGYRAAIQMIAPWIKVRVPELRVSEDTPMIARVRWTPKRVCLEGFEVRTQPVSVRIPNGSNGGGNDTFSSWLVGKGSTYARVSSAEGVEWRQPLECTITPP